MSSARQLPKLVGCEKPRIFTPPLRRLTARTSMGFSVIDFADTVLEIDLLPWQKWLLIHSLELLPDRSFRFRNVVVLVSRQNGKSTLSQVLALWFMYVYGFNLVLGTAQDLDTAEEVWQGAVDLVTELDVDDEPVRPELFELHGRTVMVNGKKSLELTTGARYKVKAASRRAGRGLSGDLVLLDELREHQTWDAWGAITKTTMARAEAQVWALSNAGDASSIVLRYLRKMAHAALGDPDGICGDDVIVSGVDDDETDDSSLGIFEWSAPPGCAVTDRDGWAQANPALGHTIAERTLRDSVRTDPEWVFRTECLCQWSDGSLEGPFPAGTWEAGLRPGTEIVRDDRVRFGLDVSWGRSMAYINVAGYAADGSPMVVVAAGRYGVDWVVPWFRERASERSPMTVALQGKGAEVSSLIDDLKAVPHLTVYEWQGPELAAWHGRFYDLIVGTPADPDDPDSLPVAGVLTHLPQPVLDLAAATAVTKPLGDAWVWDRRKSPNDVAPLVAATAAAGLLLMAVPEPVKNDYVFI